MASKVLKSFSLPPANECIPESDGFKIWRPQCASIHVQQLGIGQEGVVLSVQAYGGELTEFVLTPGMRDHLVLLLQGKEAPIEQAAQAAHQVAHAG